MAMQDFLARAGAAIGTPKPKRKKPAPAVGRKAIPQPREDIGTFLNTAKSPAPAYRGGAARKPKGAY